MKKLLCILTAAVALCGCSEGSDKISIAYEKGYECGDIINAIEKYYGTNDITVTEEDRDKISDSGCTVAIGSVPMGDPLSYGMWKSKAIKYETACIISRDEYKMSADLESVKIGVPADFEYIRFVSVPEDAKVENYSDRAALISDLKEGVIDAIICSDSAGGEIASAVEGARINTLLDSEIYEYTVMSEDIDLINSLDAVIK